MTSARPKHQDQAPADDGSIQAAIKQTKPFRSRRQEALVGLLLTAEAVRWPLQDLLAGHGQLTFQQYNVLRILRGALPGGYARGEIARRMLQRAPDLTRMIDRLVKLGLVERTRSIEDARQSIARITRRGQQLLEQVQPAMDASQSRFSASLTAREARELSRLCEKIYASSVEPADE